MANLSITSVCNRNCSYCFAMDTLERMPHPDAHMSLDVFERSLDFLHRSGIHQARLLGGEPTIHPQFCEMIDRALQRGFTLVVLSGGLIPERSMTKLEGVPADRLTILMNVAVPGEDRPSEVARQPETMRRLGNRIVLGLNIHSPSVRLDFLLDWIDSYQLQRAVRLGVAHPIAGGSNRFLHPRHYPEVGRRVADFALRCGDAGVSIEFDCGWVPCMFPDGALRALGLTAGEIGLRCNPILDVLSNGQVISCYPLADHHRIFLDDRRTDVELRDEFNTRQLPERAMMLYEACAECEYRVRGECSGGCLAGSMRRQRGRHFSVADTDNSGIAQVAHRHCAPELPIVELSFGGLHGLEHN